MVRIIFVENFKRLDNLLCHWIIGEKAEKINKVLERCIEDIELIRNE